MIRLRTLSRVLALAPFALVGACGGGGSSSPAIVTPTITQIALSPLTVTLAPGGTQQLTVTATYSDGSTKALSASSETFTSSNNAIATVSSAGVLTVAAGASGSATISAADPASGLSTSSANSTVVTVATVSSIALAPLTVSLAAGGTQQLTVTATYSNGKTAVLPASGETFVSSDPSVATVDANGLVKVVGSTAGASTTVTATDKASNKTTAPAESAVVTISSGTTTGPTANSVTAATLTAKNNAACTLSSPYYWEIGNKNGALVSGIHADAAGSTLDQQNNPISPATSLWSIASASKWIYASYVIEARGAAHILDGTDPSIPYLNFTSGFTYLGNFPPKTPCPNGGTVDDCLASTPTTPDATSQGRFYYDSDHMERHASNIMGLGADGIGALASAVQAQLGLTTNFKYTLPLLAAGGYTTANEYASFLRGILAGKYQMSQTLAANTVCTNSTVAGCNAVPGQSPITNASTAAGGNEAWSYSMGHWIEDDPTLGDGAFSSPGATGFYPWIDRAKAYYGVIARADIAATGTGTFEGYKSAVCGRLVRAAWETGVEQTTSIPQKY